VLVVAPRTGNLALDFTPRSGGGLAYDPASGVMFS
jgi:hypothetical protein